MVEGRGWIDRVRMVRRMGRTVGGRVVHREGSRRVVNAEWRLGVRWWMLVHWVDRLMLV